MNSIRILSYNVAGLRSKLIIPGFFNYIKSFDIFCLFETHVQDGNFDIYSKYFGGYNLCWVGALRSSHFGRASGGWLLGVKNGLVSKSLCTYVWISSRPYIKLKHYSQDISLIPSYINCNNWKNDFNSFAECVKQLNNDNLVILGDLNVRVGQEQLVPEEIDLGPHVRNSRKSSDLLVNNRGKTFLELCEEYGLIILNGRTDGDLEGVMTFIGGNGSSVNDFVAVSLNITKHVLSLNVQDEIYSDHFPVSLVLSSNTPLNRKEKNLELLPRLNWSIQNISEYRERIINICAETQHNILSGSTEDLVNIITQAARKKGKSIVAYRQKWFDGECLRARNRSFKWLNVFRKTDSDLARSNYLRTNKNYKELCKNKKASYFENMANKLGLISDSKAWWKLAKELRGNKFKVGISISVESFRVYFQSLFNPKITYEPVLYAAPNVRDAILDRNITMDELIYVLNTLKNGKAPGIDRIPYEFYKNAPDVFLEKLLCAYNLIFEKEEVPASFTRTVIFPIFKKGEADNVENYRGLSFMDSIVKIFTGIIYQRLSLWEKTHGILSESQAGFRAGYSTMDNIYNLMSIVKLAHYYNKKKIYAFFIDFKSAFDTIIRSSLFYKLYNCGVSSKLVRILQGLYHNTTAQVWNGTTLSDSFGTNCGVKQGCVLSPLLFAIFINDLEDFLGESFLLDDIEVKILLYADDIVLLSDDPSKLQKQIDKIHEYCQLWGLIVNLEKSKIMIFQRGTGPRKSSENWTFDGRSVEVVKKYTYLGVIVTPKLSMTQHLRHRLCLAKTSLNSTWKNFTMKAGITHSHKIKLFDAVSRSVLCYAAQVWGYNHYEDVEKLQRFFLKKMFHLPSQTPNYVLLLETDLPNLYIHTLSCHFRYILRTLFDYGTERLPHKLSWRIVDKNIFWFEGWQDLAEKHDISLNVHQASPRELSGLVSKIVQLEEVWLKNRALDRARATVRHGVYDKLSYTEEVNYFLNDFSIKKISMILRYRCGLLNLNASPWRSEGSSICSLCNLMENEDLMHFLGICPILSEFRSKAFGKKRLSESEVIEILNGRNKYNDLYQFAVTAWRYREFLISEYNN